MAGKTAARPNTSKCFGLYRQQSVEYALQNCLTCPKMKACVRVAWGMDQPARPKRGVSDRTKRRLRVGRRPPWPSSPESLAT